MLLQRVVYEIFESDRAALEGNENASWHELDREVCLETDTSKIYVSWCSEPEQYAIGHQSTSFFSGEAEDVLDVSAWEMWRKVVGENIELIFVDEGHQVLEIRGKTGSVFVSSQEQGRWWSDVVHVSTERPMPDA